ncbi:MAG: RuBisCO large subunit C-terminal-like domain-containing protein [Elusimicrobiota bacterium]|nr:RuBisCO large subunit C-terminal-like domain-containing protein [Elusimicrobiota bacterium]
MQEKLVAVYELPGPEAEALRLAKAVAWEETVEVPEDFPLPAGVRDGVVGKVGAATPAGDGRFRVEVEFPAALGGRVGTLLNLVFGNASIWPGLRLVDLRLPGSLLASLPGPGHGVDGLRALTDARGRPLLATALKPMGSSVESLAAAAAAFAAGGGDLVKDDQNLVDRDLAAFKDRVARIAEAVAAAGTRCLYLPHLSGPQEELDERLDFALACGLKGVLACPAILGLDEVRRLAASRRVVVMAHPAFSGALYCDRSHGIETALWHGVFMRLIGADLSVFPNAGGRFGFTPEECRRIAARCREPLGPLAAALPAPGGGMRLDRAADLARDFGPDAAWLVGGSLLMHPGGPKAGAAAFREAMAKAFPG